MKHQEAINQAIMGGGNSTPSSSSFLDNISSNRTYLMGVAMLFVIVYHAFCWIYNPIGFFNIGYVGVDIFLFLSGFGLAHSYRTNSLSRFYKNRLLRIYPIYFIAVFATYLIFCYKIWGVDDLLFNLISVGFYTKGGTQRYDWYLEGLFTLYLLFPVFYHYAKLRYSGLLIFFALTAFTLYIFDISWWYDCFIGRLPIFLYGIMFCQCFKSAKLVGIMGLILYIPCRIIISPFLASSLLVIGIVYVSLLFIKHLIPSVKKAIEYIGKHSLEIYIANLFIYWTTQIYSLNNVEKIALYIIIQTIGTFLVIATNKYISKFLLKNN